MLLLYLIVGLLVASWLLWQAGDYKPERGGWGMLVLLLVVLWPYALCYLGLLWIFSRVQEEE